MRLLLILLLSYFSISVSASDVFDTTCKDQDCFTNGWVTTGDDYTLDTECVNKDCETFGWNSVANDDSTYHVQCKPGGCFRDGWHSVQRVGAFEYRDEVTCKKNECLKYGWRVRTGYDLMGGNVTCHLDDCSRFGGYSVWRYRTSHTVCKGSDCYQNGWWLYIDEWPFWFGED